MKKKIISLLTAFTVALSFGTASAFEGYDESVDDLSFVKLDYNYIEELPDGGRIYVYVIDGAESSFPVPPEGFSPLTATDEQLETYGFPPRPNEENADEYNDWVELMKCYKSTPIPDIEVRRMSESNQISTSNSRSGKASTTFAGYYSNIQGTQFYTQAQVDYEQPRVINVKGSCANEFWIGFGNPEPSAIKIKTGTKNFGKNKAYAFAEYKDVFGSEEVKLGMIVSPGDKLHIYISFQKASHKYNYYIANNTTGESVSNLVSPPVSGEVFDGHYVTWGAGRVLDPNDLADGAYNLGQCSVVTMKNCKAMLNTSTSWTDLKSLNGLQQEIMYNGGDYSQDYMPGGITDNNCFTLTWLRYGE